MINISDNNVYTHLDPESRSGTSKSKNKSMQEDEMLNDISQKVHFVKQTPIEQPPVPQEPNIQESKEPEPKEPSELEPKTSEIKSKKHVKIPLSVDYFNAEIPRKDETYTSDSYRIRNDPLYRKHRYAQIMKWQKEHPEYHKEYIKRIKLKGMKDILLDEENIPKPELTEQEPKEQEMTLQSQKPKYKEWKKQYQKDYYRKNKEKLDEYQKEYMREYKKRPEVIERDKQSLTEKRHKQRLTISAVTLPKPSRILHTRNAYIYTDKETYDKAVEMNKQVLPGRKKIILFRDPQIEKERIRQNRIFLRLKRKK